MVTDIKEKCQAFAACLPVSWMRIAPHPHFSRRPARPLPDFNRRSSQQQKCFLRRLTPRPHAYGRTHSISRISEQFHLQLVAHHCHLLLRLLQEHRGRTSALLLFLGLQELTPFGPSRWNLFSEMRLHNLSSLRPQKARQERELRLACSKQLQTADQIRAGGEAAYLLFYRPPS